MKTTPLTFENIKRRTDDAPDGKPAGHRLMIRVPEPKDKTDSGLWKPEETKDAEKRTCEKGTCVIVGDTAFNIYDAPWCEAGDVVHFVRHAGKPMEIGKEFYRIINDEDIWFVEGNTKEGRVE